MGKNRGSERVDNSLTIVCWMKKYAVKVCGFSFFFVPLHDKTDGDDSHPCVSEQRKNE